MRHALLALIAALALSSAADAKVLITIDKSVQRMTVAVDGVPRWTWPVSTGRRGHDTPSGSYTAFRMEKDHFSKEWDDAPMPNSIFFTKRGHAIHGSFETKRLGMPASAGCVRLHPDNASKLYALVEQQGVVNATVVVTGGEPAPAVARETPRRAPYDEEALPGYGARGYRPAYAAPAYQQPPSSYRPQPGYEPPPTYYRRGGLFAPGY